MVAGTMVAASSTTTVVPRVARNEASCFCISTVAVGDVDGSSSDPCDAGCTKRPARSTPPAFIWVLEYDLSPMALINGSVPDKGAV